MTSAAICIMLLGVFAEVTRSLPGCQKTEHAGLVIVSCESESAADVATLWYDRSNGNLQLRCEAGAYTDVMMPVARSRYANHITTTETIARLEVEGCSLEKTKSLGLALQTINGTGVETLILRNVQGELVHAHIPDLKFVHNLQIWYYDNSSTSMPYETLSKLKNLSAFKARKGNVHVHPDRHLLQITDLEIAECELKSLPARSFNSTPDVVNMSLFANGIDVIDEEAFIGLSKMELLNLNNNDISHLPPTVFHRCDSLKYLFLLRNKIKLLYSNLFAHSTRLEEVDISFNRVEMVIEDKTFANLSSLRNLIIEASGVENLPQKLFQGSPLETLNLSKNKIEFLPSKVFAFQVALASLDLSENEIRNISFGLFGGLAKLFNLDLSKNKLQQLESGSFDGLGSLRKLNLAHNQLTTLSQSTFDVIQSLRELSVSHNRLQMSTISPFLPLRQLNRLELQNCTVARVCRDWRKLEYLRELDLSHNEITRLTKHDMDWRSSVEIINFSYNNITNIDPLNYSRTGIPKFVLHHNSFSCDCASRSFIKASKDNKSFGIPNEKDLVCSSPAELAGRTFSSLTGEVLRCSSCPTDCSCGIRNSPTTDVYELNCSSVPTPFPLVDSDLTVHLTLRSIPEQIKNVSPRVKYLTMSNMSMTEVPLIDACSEVDLRHNLLTEAPLRLLEANCSVKLAGNPFKCDCDNQQTFMSLKKYENLIIDFTKVTCDGGLSVLSNGKDFCVTKNAILLGLTVSAGLLLLGACLIFICANKNTIPLYLIKYGLYSPRQADRRHTKFDAFLSYEDDDEKYVFEHLIPKLEGGRWPLKLCIPCRDWRVGALISEEISRTVQESRVTLVVLSRNYGKTTWRDIEFRTAQALQRIIVLLTDDVENRLSELGLTTYTSMNKCIKSSDKMALYRIKRAAVPDARLVRRS